jgi:hypothetical protein
MSTVRLTRSSDRKRKIDEGLPLEDAPKPKHQTLGQHLAEERER